MLDTVFKNLNLPEQAVKVYLQLLENGPSTAGKLAKKLSIPRSTLYGFLDELLLQRLVGQSEREGIKLWMAKPPAEIARLLKDKVTDWQKLTDNFSLMLIDLESKQKLDFSFPRFQIFEGVAGVKKILRDMLLYRDITSQAIWPAKDMLEILGAEFHYELNLQRIRQNIYTQGIWPEDKVVSLEKNPFFGSGADFKREICQGPKGFTTSMGYWAYADKVAFVSSQRECFGFLVESRELRQLLKAQFSLIWQLSTPLNLENKHAKDFLKRL